MESVIQQVFRVVCSQVWHRANAKAALIRWYWAIFNYDFKIARVITRMVNITLCENVYNNKESLIILLNDSCILRIEVLKLKKKKKKSL